MKFAPSATSLISPAKFHCRGGINDAIVIKELRASHDDRREGRWSRAWTSSGLQLSAQAEWTFSRLRDQILFLSLNLFNKFALWPRWEISFSFFFSHVIFQEHLQLTASRENKVWCKVGSDKYVYTCMYVQRDRVKYFVWHDASWRELWRRRSCRRNSLCDASLWKHNVGQVIKRVCRYILCPHLGLTSLRIRGLFFSFCMRRAQFGTIIIVRKFTRRRL